MIIASIHAPHRRDAAAMAGRIIRAMRHAHATGELANLRYGVALARRGRVRRHEVLDALDADAFARAVAPGGSGHGPRQPADR